jgi:hypothetical protein
MAMKIVISFKAMKKMLYSVKYMNFIDFYDLKARLLLCGKYFEETSKNVNLNHMLIVKLK